LNLNIRSGKGFVKEKKEFYMPQKIEKTAHFSEPPFDAMVLTA
jgi:hypothetical protein